MNLITNLKRYFRGAGAPTQNEKPAQAQSSYRQLLLSLQQACAHMPDGEAFVTLDKGEFSVRMTWNPGHNEAQEPLMFSLNARGEVIQWMEEKPDGVVDPRVRMVPMSRKDKDSAKEKARQDEAKPSKQQRMMQSLSPSRRGKAVEAATDDAEPGALPEAELRLPLQQAGRPDGMRQAESRHHGRRTPLNLYTRGHPHAERHRHQRHR